MIKHPLLLRFGQRQHDKAPSQPPPTQTEEPATTEEIEAVPGRRQLDETLAMMVHTTALEEKTTAGASYIDCFKGHDLRRTEIVCMVWAIQNLSGNSFSNYSTYFLTQAGLDSNASYSFALGQYAMNMVGVFGAWWLMSLGIGRR